MGPEDFLKERFRSYYSKAEVEDPPGISEREFGYGTFGKKISNRHLSFEDRKDLNSFLVNEVPLYISCSSARYKFPGRKPMSAKESFSVDLIYEFDADDLETSCKEKHDSWECKCGEHGKGRALRCPKCGQHTSLKEWVCPECLGATKKQTLKLLGFFENDFSLTEGISLNFSGHKGYHIHVRNEEISKLSQSARIDLLDYLTAHNLSPQLRGFTLDGKKMLCPPLGKAGGWNRRILDRIVSLLEEEDADRIAVWGKITKAESKRLLNDKDKIITGMKAGLLYQLPGRKTEKFWLSLIEGLVGDLALDIDRQTSVDASKIVRVPNTLHGSTGLLAKTFSRESLKKFRPLEETIVFSENAVKVSFGEECPRFILNGKNFGPFIESAELPEYAAIYLLGKGVADGIIV